MELYRKVRLACRDGMSERAAARHFGVSRESVRKMLAFSVPPGYRRTAPVRRPKLDGFTGLIDEWLRGDRKEVLGGIDTGACLLAKSGVLRGYKCTTQWDHRDALIEDHPVVVVTTGVCVFDRDRITCAGGGAPGDLMMNFIAREHGRHLAAAIAEQLVHDRIRGTHDAQRRPLVQHIGTGQPRLVDAVQLMEANLEEPLPVEQIAELVELSRRQLERLFRRHLKCVPSHYYLRVRLEKAHHLLRQTSHPVMSVALAAGFVSASHFSKAYKDLFGYGNDEERPSFNAVEIQ